MAGRYTGSYLGHPTAGAATLAEIGQASLVGRIPEITIGLQPNP